MLKYMATSVLFVLILSSTFDPFTLLCLRWDGKKIKHTMMTST